MRITVIGRGNVGGGLAKRWRAAGHEVTEIGRDGGDASGSEAVLVAVPFASIADAIGSVTGIGGTPVVDATNLFGGDRPEGLESLAAYVKSLVDGPVAKAFNLNFAALYDRIDEARATPSMLYAAEDGAREVAERLIEDAGYAPVSAGGLDAARMLEDHLPLMFAVSKAGTGQFLYRMAPPERL